VAETSDDKRSDQGNISRVWARKIIKFDPILEKEMKEWN
jgi:hypothetical protein